MHTCTVDVDNDNDINHSLASSHLFPRNYIHRPDAMATEGMKLLQFSLRLYWHGCLGDRKSNSPTVKILNQHPDPDSLAIDIRALYKFVLHYITISKTKLAVDGWSAGGQAVEDRKDGDKEAGCHKPAPQLKTIELNLWCRRRITAILTTGV